MNTGKLTLLSDVIETKLRKEKELEFYQRELEKLQQKMFFLKKDIEVTNLCISIIEQEKVLDIKEQMEKMMRNLMNNMTNEEMLDKIEYEGAEYFFLDYISLDSIKDEELRKNVQILRLAWEDILADVAELEREIYDKD